MGRCLLVIGSIAHVFEKTYGFSQGQGGTVFICGFSCAFLSYILFLAVREPLCRKALAKVNGEANPEVRLYSAVIGWILFSAGLSPFAWMARPWIQWIMPHLGNYLVLGNIHDRSSSSAQAVQSLLRTILGATLAFFRAAMYDRLTFPWASTPFIAGAFAIVPWGLIFYSPLQTARLRARSRVSISVEQQEGDVPGEGPVSARLT
ncbi:MSF transporter [Rhodotorula toruloides]|uniref:MSF transporter n=1 Tax=Rhodotorula toruloides TaxID=5286 RepID=A0A511KGT8_RHOTO|nr:MSF transporter [Rhodotorula toruloides]